MIAAPAKHLLFCALLVLAACTPRADVMPKAAPDGIGTDVTVFVGTTRTRTETGDFESSDRGDLGFARIDVSIPPAHEAGRVEVGGENPDPKKHFLSRSIQPMGASRFRDEVAQQLAANPQYHGEVFVFVHGFNNTMGDGVFRTAQIASDLGIHALPVHYAWPSGGHPLGYPFDRDSALYARNGLQHLIEELTASGAKNIILLAHSMGSQVTMETLRQMSLSGRGAAWDRIGGVVLMAPDLDVDLFRQQAGDIGPLPQPFLILASQRDAVLRLSARLTGQDERLGNISSIDDLSALEVIVIDLSGVRDTWNSHMVAVASPTIIRLMSDPELVESAFQSAQSARLGLLPGTILTVQNATEIILDPASASQIEED
ncbi:alpha/beta fold hydrolase [Tropicimonas sp. TH_r6]|uniref:alpha/beta hydrolase n=1 Tax=Tropicimonas sp. TH_r6 TaxID=3082085 RepID=UPI002953C62B|nr:alpha/beta fold hydrolase [Tropicimonas sp. TH_r6]MDV7141290.1 alpha/beta fold hydrolase [Tropicimonas sp. TH_r6]